MSKTARRIVTIVLAVALLLAISALAITQLPQFGAAADGERLKRVMRSERHISGKFENLEETHTLVPGKLIEMITHQFFGDEQRVPPQPVPVVKRRAADYAVKPAHGIRATWLGHASVLIEIAGGRVLTDPIFSERCSPFSYIGPERVAAVPFAAGDVPLIDVVVISHDHYDHLDMATIQALSARGTRFVVPLGIGAHLERWGVPKDRVVDLDWYQSFEHQGLMFTATPARHYSGRGLLDSDQTLWASWVIAGPSERVFFSGDTGYSAEFKKIGERFGPFQLTLIKIGASDPTWQQIHMSAEEAVKTHQDVRGQLLLPIHWGTFNLAYHAWNEPADRALAAAQAANVAIALPKPGEWVDPSAPPQITTWWH